MLAQTIQRTNAASWKCMKLALTVVAIMAASILTAETYYVSLQGSDANTGVGGWENAVEHIATAISRAGQGDTIWLSNGTYVLNGELTIAQDITLRGYSTNASDTVIDGGYPDRENRCLTLNHADALVCGLTIQNGSYPSQNIGGGGVYINSGGTVSNCIVRFNRCARGGGGIHIAQNGLVSDSIITDNLSVAGNTTAQGGGIYISVTGRVERCRVAQNSAYYGGGVAIGQNGMLSNVDVLSNTSTYFGGGTYIAQNGTLLDCHLIGNSTIQAHNNAKGGGLAAVADDAEVEIHGGSIVSNYAYHGGGVYAGSATKIYKVDIMHNACDRNGGGGYGGNYTACTIADNHAALGVTGGGGGLFSPHDVSGCTLDGNSCFIYGGGIYLRDVAASVTVSGCVITANTVGANTGGGIAIKGDFATPLVKIVDCLISNNYLNGTSLGGAGIGADVLNNIQTVQVERCIIVDNHSKGHGGGCYFYSITEGSVEIRNSLIANNTADNDGGGVYLDVTGDGILENCTIMNNQTDAGKVAGLWGANAQAYSVMNSIIYDNLAGGGTVLNYPASAALFFTNSCVYPLPAHAVDTITDMPAVKDAATGNYRLTPGSPCVNSGLNQGWMLEATDLDGCPRLDRFSQKVDIGCFELIHSGTILKIY